jgi:predicted RNA methylase
VSATAGSAIASDVGAGTARKKRLGQYFTSERLARLLAGLADADRAAAILDPMVGAADMLAGAVAAGARPRVLAGVEIDARCLTAARARLSGPVLARGRLIEGDAFSLSTLRALPRRSWDLVITNPPYVRYQITAAGDGALFPNAIEVRTRLLQTLGECDALHGEDRELFRHLTSAYSGLSDLAVPAWLLCAALVAPGGTLAMVVPDTWLSRDYASPIQYVLARCFDVRFVVRDSDAVWFEDALVRTTLVVADRVATRKSAFDQPGASGYLDIALRAGAVDSRSLVGAAYPDASDPDHAFARDARRWRTARGGPTSDVLEVTWVPASHTAALLNRATRDQKWRRSAEGVDGERPPSAVAPALPLRLKRAMRGESPAFVGLDTLGWRVGQGLRTGANTFFYGEATTGERSGRVEVATSRRLGGPVVGVAADATLPVVRNQADLPESLTLRSEAVRGRVLVFSEYALPEDVERDREASPYRVMDEDLARFVREAARTNVGSAASPKVISKLSAVVTNVRAARRNGSLVPARYWYQLPELTARHRPELFFARVNHGHPVTFLNLKQATVVDANFSTLWREAKATVAGPYAMLALMNSGWATAILELSGTVLGAGALKVEASHLRRLPIPVMGAGTWRQLEHLGKNLARGSRQGATAVLGQIDDAVASELTPRRTGRLSCEIREIAALAAAGRRR